MDFPPLRVAPSYGCWGKYHYKIPHDNALTDETVYPFTSTPCAIDHTL